MDAFSRIFASLRRTVLLVAAVPCSLLLHACGGGLSLTFGDFVGIDNSPPSVNLAAAVTSVQAGQQVRFVAAASDENGIDSVAFYRLDNGNAVVLGSDGDQPYEWIVTAPADGRTTLTVFARAIDNTGNRSDSASVTIAVTP
jgi:hypothetical protein